MDHHGVGNQKGIVNQTKMDKFLYWAGVGVVIFAASIFIGLNTAKCILYEQKGGDYLSTVIAYSFLALFIMMAAVNIVLFRVLRKQSDILYGFLEDGQNYFRKE